MIHEMAIKAKTNENASTLKEYLRIIEDEEAISGRETPLRPDAFLLNDSAKVQKIAMHFEEIMKTLGLDLEDQSLKDTPMRVAKMYVNEIFSGLNPENKPSITLFENKYKYKQMLVEKNIKVHSYCEHHFVPIIGKAHIAYISDGQVVGLSKINRIVDYFSRRPQVQERLTEQIADELKKSLLTEDVAVMIDADHMCVTLRGIKDENSSTTTSSFHGRFLEDSYRKEFLTYVFNQK
jgi:GTP cyclohydrolase IA